MTDSKKARLTSADSDGKVDVLCMYCPCIESLDKCLNNCFQNIIPL